MHVEHILTGKAIVRALRAHLLVDAAVNTLVVSKALKVAIPGLQDKSGDPPSVKDESYDHEADVAPNAQPSEDGRQNCDLQESRSLFDELMNKRKSAEEVSAADVLTRIKHLQDPRSHEGQLHCFTVAAIPLYGRHPLHVHKGRTNRQLETSSSRSVTIASLSSCCIVLAIQEQS